MPASWFGPSAQASASGREISAHRPRLRHKAAARRIVAHVGQQFTPASTLPPTIARTPVQGQTLTTSTGTFGVEPPERTRTHGSAAMPARRAPTSWEA